MAKSQIVNLYESEDGESSPECMLLINVLLRSIRDLQSGESHMRQKAIEWFSDTTTRGLGARKLYISYRDVLDHVAINESIRNYIIELIS